MWQALFKTLSPGGAGARLSTLIFHRVLSEADPLFPEELDQRQFNDICAWVARWFNVLPLDEAVVRLGQGKLPARALAITFDDGYADNEAVAVPILLCHGLPATFFVATGFLDGGRMWNDTLIETVRRTSGTMLDLTAFNEPRFRELAALGCLPLGQHSDWAARRAAIGALLPRVKYLAPDDRQWFVEALASSVGVQLPRDLMMSSHQLRALRDAGMGVGAHTVSHPILARVSDDVARVELLQSKQHLERFLQQPVGLFAYPNGKSGDDYDERHVAMARDCGFTAAMATQWGVAHAGSDPFQLPRFTPWDRSRWRFAARMAVNLRRR